MCRPGRRTRSGNASRARCERAFEASIETTGTDAALADRREQLLETRASDTGAGTAEVIVDDFHCAPAQGARPIDQTIPAVRLSSLFMED